MGASPRATSTQSAHVPTRGDVLGGKYRVDGVLAIGGMGAVLAATHVELGQRVAVKVMLPVLLEKPEFETRFFREGRAAALLRSEHAARVFDFGRLDDGVPFLVMELLDGCDLEKLVRERGPRTVEDAVGYVLQACDPIAEAHALGIIHRDVKPSNLFLVRGPGPPMVKVLDFGISKSMQPDPSEWEEGPALTATQATLGSPAYMSPEQLRNAKSVDGRTDLWSLGLVLHWLLTGRLAFESGSLGAHLAMVINDPPTSLRERRPDAPAELEEVVLRCLQKDLGRRFQNAGQLALALAPFAPPWARDVIPRVVARCGEATVAGGALPPLEQATPRSPPGPHAGAATQASWTPLGTQTRAKSLRMSLQAGALVAAVLLGVTAQRLLGATPSPAQGSTEAPPALAPQPTAPPEAPPSPAPPPGGEPLAAEISIRLHLEPRGATVEVDGVAVRDNPVRLPRSDGAYRIVVSAPGYASEEREILALADAELTFSLRRLAGGHAHPPAPGPTTSPAPAPEPTKRLKGPMETHL